MVRRPPVVLAAVCALSCGQRKESGEQPAAEPDGAGVRLASPGGEASGPDRRCADFAACRDACIARRPGGCVRMRDRAAPRDGTGAEAEKVANRMCDAGHPEACYVRSIQLAGDKRHSGRAVSRACDLGYGQACAELAGTTVDRSRAAELRARAFALLERHCRSENPYACTALGHAAASPPGREPADPAKARWYYDKACNLGDEDACHALARQLVGEHPRLGATLLDRACELGEPRACADAGDLYASGRGIERDMQRAASSWQLACDSGARGTRQACDSLASALLDGRLPRDPGRAAALHKRGAELAGERERN